MNNIFKLMSFFQWIALILILLSVLSFFYKSHVNTEHDILLHITAFCGWLSAFANSKTVAIQQKHVDMLKESLAAHALPTTLSAHSRYPFETD